MTAAETGAARLRLPADRRLACRTGPLGSPEEAIQAFLGHLSRGELDALPPFLDDGAKQVLFHLIQRRGAEALAEMLRRRCRAICDCRLERRLELPDGTSECRLRIFRMQVGGQIRSCYWLVQARRIVEESEAERWLITSFDPLPGAEDPPIMPPAEPGG